MIVKGQIPSWLAQGQSSGACSSKLERPTDSGDLTPPEHLLIKTSHTPPSNTSDGGDAPPREDKENHSEDVTNAFKLKDTN